MARLDAVVAKAQRRAIRSAIAECGGDIPKAAKLLGRNSHALYRPMWKLAKKTKHSRVRSSFAALCARVSSTSPLSVKSVSRLRPLRQRGRASRSAFVSETGVRA
ncbi:MAG: hypothetical protein HUU19_00635 [Phycisphaerales bacterium]|nr:hypothetical protein [Phycisphaerales bacterium]